MDGNKLVDEFNRRFVIGDIVNLIRDDGSIQPVKIKYPASINAAGIAVGWFKQIRGAYLLARVEELCVKDKDRCLGEWAIERYYNKKRCEVEDENIAVN